MHVLATYTPQNQSLAFSLTKLLNFKWDYGAVFKGIENFNFQKLKKGKLYTLKIFKFTEDYAIKTVGPKEGFHVQRTVPLCK